MKPLYQTILIDLKEKILNGELPTGSKVPTEKELSSLYGVSRITSKRALTELEQLNMIQRIRGKGSFVTDFQIPNQTTTQRVLFLLPFSNDLSLGNFYEGLLPITQQEDFEVMMTSLDFLKTHTAQEITQEFDGMIYYTEDEHQHLDLLFDLSFQKFPIIVLDKPLHDLKLPTILSDNFSGGKKACDFLIKQRHKKIAYIFGEAPAPQSTRQRYLGYIQSLKEHNLAFHTTLNDPKATLKHLTSYITSHNITALICENDLIAIEATRILKQHGVDLPIDVSIVGFDNIQAAALVEPALTTISQNFKKIGELAGKALLQWIKSEKIPQNYSIPVKLVIRHSTKEVVTYDRKD